MNIGVLCSDHRMYQVKNNLSKDFEVISIDTSTDWLTLPQLDALVLPVQGMDKEANVLIQGKNMHIPSRFWHIQGKEVKLFSGRDMKTPLCQFPLYCYMKDETVIDENAILTAEGVLFEILRATNKSIYSTKVDIVGYGHCGKAVYQMLKNLQVDVRVIRRFKENKYDFLTYEDWKECGDIIVHTATGKIIEEKRILQWKKKPVILDISTLCFFDEKFLKNYEIIYKRLGNLPGRFAYVSAGNIIANYVRRKLSAEK